MTRLTFRTSAPLFAVIMAVKQNAILHEDSHPWVVSVVHDSFYVDDGLTGASSVSEGLSTLAK